MNAVSKKKAIEVLHQKRVCLFTVPEVKKILGIKKKSDLYKLLQRLEEDKIIKRILKGKYHFLFEEINDFELANFLVEPSYVSLETALAFYGIKTYFPEKITSVTTQRSKTINYKKRECEFQHIKEDYFFGFEKKGEFLIATPEKSILDEVYFISQGLRKINLDRLDFSGVNKEKIGRWSKRYKFVPFRNLLKEIGLI